MKSPATLAMAAKAKALKRAGADVVSFSLGEPDFDTPEPIRRACREALEAGQTHYSPTLGDIETRGVIAQKLTRENALPGVTAEHVAISAGAKHSLYLVLHCLLDPESTGDATGEGGSAGNEVLLPVPAWVSYAPIAELAGGRVVELDTRPTGGFKITPDQLRRAITPRSRVLILNSPSNPCGTMYTPDELRALAGVVSEAAASVAPNMVIVTDEIYEKIIYGGVPHLSIGSLPGVAGRTVTINGLSKAHAMTGWRVGYSAASGEFGLALARAIESLQGQMTSCIPSFIYPAVRVALTEGAAATEQFRQQFARRAALISDLATKVPEMPFTPPVGAFYLFPDVSAFLGRRTGGGRVMKTSIDLAESLLSDVHLAVVPGEEFGGCGRNHLRLSFACSEALIREGMTRLSAFLAGLK